MAARYRVGGRPGVPAARRPGVLVERPSSRSAAAARRCPQRRRSAVLGRPPTMFGNAGRRRHAARRCRLPNRGRRQGTRRGARRGDGLAGGSRQVHRGVVAVAGSFGHAFGDDHVEASRQPRVGVRRLRRRSDQVVADLLLQGVATDCVLCGQALIENTGQRVDIRAGVDRRGADLLGFEPFGGHVTEGPDHAARCG